MKPRICLFGNSHIAALRQAMMADPSRWSNMDITTIGARDNALMETRCVDEILTPQSDAAKANFRNFGGVDKIVCDDYDALFIVGCNFSTTKAAALYQFARWYHLPSVQQSTRPRTVISQAAFMACLASTMAGDLGGLFLAHLRKGTQRPIYVVSQPRISAQLRTMPDHRLKMHLVIMHNGDGDAVSTASDASIRQFCVQYDAQFLPQPAQTIDAGMLTHTRYMNGAIKLLANRDVPQPRQDVYHANAAYGALIMDQIQAVM